MFNTVTVLTKIKKKIENIYLYDLQDCGQRSGT